MSEEPSSVKRQGVTHLPPPTNAAEAPPVSSLVSRKRSRSEVASDRSDEVAAPGIDLPVAPTLQDFLAPGGSRRFRPREEWYSVSEGEPPVPVYRSARAAQAAFPSTARTVVPVRPRVSGHRQQNGRHYHHQQQQQRSHPQPYHQHHDEGLHEDRHPDNNGAAEEADDVTIEDERHPSLVDLDVFVGLIRQHGNGLSMDTTERTPAVSAAATTTEPALFLAIRENATDAALKLIRAGASVTLESSKGITPLVLAAQKGNISIVQALLEAGAHPASVAANGSTALLQAAHFGHLPVVRHLLQRGPPQLAEMANLNSTTPLMRAAQEGHAEIVLDLLRVGAAVNRRNRCHMSALMLASQRGHDSVCQHLIQYGADVDARTHQDSTSLLLACKRSHVSVIHRLVAAGCELWVKDSRGRTARDVVQRRLELARDAPTREKCQSMLGLLDSPVQQHLMRLHGRQLRFHVLMAHWHLLHQERAIVAVPLSDGPPMNLSQVPALLDHTAPYRLPYPLGLKSTQALLRTMLLPAPLVQLIAAFMPLPHFWERSIGMLTRRATIDPDETVVTALDLMDEILEEGGFVEACDAASVPPPPHHATWRDWKAFGRRCGQVIPVTTDPTGTTNHRRPNVTLATVATPAKTDHPTLVEHRRAAGFLSVLRDNPRLARFLQTPPSTMAAPLCAQLSRTADLGSLVRRMSSGIHVDTTVAMDLVMLVSRLCGWYWRHSECTFVPSQHL